MVRLDPEVRALLDQPTASSTTSASELTAESVRADDLSVLDLQRPPGGLYSMQDIEIPSTHGIPTRLYRPRPGPLQPVLFLHGGGFVVGRDGYEAPLQELALAADCLLVAPEFRLAPENPFPAAADDALTVARWLGAEATTLGSTAGRLGVAGDSSGGNLAATATHQLAREGTPPAYQLLIYPMLDATASSASYTEFAEGYGFTRQKSCWYFDQYLPPDVDRHSPRASPLFDDDLSLIPRTLVVTAELDPLRDDGERYAELLRRASVTVELWRYTGMIHGFFQMTGALERSRQLHSELAHWMREAARTSAVGTCSAVTSTRSDLLPTLCRADRQPPASTSAALPRQH